MEENSAESAESLGQYLDLITEASKETPPSPNHSPSDEPRTFWFRGQADVSWKLIPFIQREFKGLLSHPKQFHEKERMYCNDFQHSASVFLENKPDLDDFPAWLTLMQHYGLPTRLLDWSQSALFALYFAIVNDTVLDDPEHKKQLPDGTVWLLDPLSLNTFAALEEPAYLYHMEHKNVRAVVRSAFRTTVDPGWEEHQKTIVACYATLCDRRVANQQSAFTVHSTLKPLKDIATEWEESHPDRPLLQRIIIPGPAKYHILDELYMSGITHRTVFPDLEHVARDIRRYYGKMG